MPQLTQQRTIFDDPADTWYGDWICACIILPLLMVHFSVIMSFVDGKNVCAFIPLGKPYPWQYDSHQPSLYLWSAYSAGKCSYDAFTCTCTYMYVQGFFQDWSQGKAK